MITNTQTAAEPTADDLRNKALWQWTPADYAAWFNATGWNMPAPKPYQPKLRTRLWGQGSQS